MPGLTIGDTVPNLELDSTHGKIRIHDYVGNGYVILFSHPGNTYRSISHVSSICRNAVLQRTYGGPWLI
jgi:hypothetical protein